MMEDLHFIRPLWLWALPLYLLLLAWFYFRKRHNGQWTHYVKPQLWRYVLTGAEASRRLRPLALLGIAGLLAILALAGPAWQRLPQPVFKSQSALIIALDLSASMNSQDIKPSRLHRARHKVTDILSRRQEGQTALIVYAGDAFTVVPLTNDVNTLRAHVATLETGLMPAQGSRADLALAKAMTLFEQTATQQGHVLLITDYIDSDRLQAARDRLLSAGHHLSILGVGTTEGAPIPVSGGGFLKDRDGAIVLAKLNADELRGLAPYHTLSIDDRDLNYLLPDTNPQLFDDSQATSLQTDIWREQGPWLLLPLLLLASFAFRRGILILACVLILPCNQPVYAFGWKDLWLNDDQRGQQAFQSEQYATASELFGDPEWRAASAYRAGDYAKAAAALQGIENAEALYNRGNALAQLGQTQQALESYNRALQQNPQHEDARYNRDLLLQQQQAQQQSDKGDSSQDQQPGQEQQSETQSSDQQQDQQDESAEGESQQAENGQQNEQKQAAQEQQAESEENKSDENAQTKQLSENESSREQQNMEQWLRRIPDDPGGLLRRKFLYQYRQQKQQPSETEPW